MELLSERIRPLFIQSGWTVERHCELPATVAPAGHPGRAILENFGGLTVGTCGPGEQCAASDIAFEAVGDPERIPEWEELLKTRLVGVAHYHRQHGELYVAEDGRCFGLDFDGTMSFQGGSVAEALESLLLGRRARPMLHPDEQEVWLYGDRYGRDHPAVYRY